MKKKLIFISALTSIAFATTFYSCSNGDAPKKDPVTKAEAPTQAEVIKEGERLITILGCNDCHSPKKMGPQGPEIIADLMLSGYPADRPIAKFDNKLFKDGFAVFYPDLTAAAGPWGVSFAGNLTSDQTGIGNWTEAQFKKALVEGKYKGLDGNRMLLPPMPWQGFSSLTNDELHAMFEYLKSVKPVKNLVPNHITPDKM